MLQKLLKSKDPNDLRKANKLIQRMVKKDQQKQEQLGNLRQQLNMMQENTRVSLLFQADGANLSAGLTLCSEQQLLSDVISNFDTSQGPIQSDEVIQVGNIYYEQMPPAMCSFSAKLFSRARACFSCELTLCPCVSNSTRPAKKRDQS